MRQLARKVVAPLLALALIVGSVPPALADTDLEIGGLAIITNTGGASVFVREGPGYDYTVITTAEEGDILTVLDGPIEGDDGNYWYDVEFGGTYGFVFADYLVLPINAPLNPVRSRSAPSPEVEALATDISYGLFVSGTGDEGARMRDGAGLDAAIILVVPEGAGVEVIGEPLMDGGGYWYPVAYAGEIGWMAGSLLGEEGGQEEWEPEPIVEAAGLPASPRTPVLEEGAHVEVSGTNGGDLRIRGTYGLDGGVAGHAPEGAVLEVLYGPEYDDAGNAWYAVDYDGLSGFASADYLAWTSEGLSGRYVEVLEVAAPPPPPPVAPPPPPPAPRAEPPKPAAAAAPAPRAAAQFQAPPPIAPSPASSGSGPAMVNVAMRFLGYPYVYAGSSPGGFDCSGFTMYVARQALGRSIGQAVPGQLGAGRAVGSKELEPGDLVFFVNTDGPGVTHVGIYIGGGQMIHAGSERTGVLISNIWDSYWGPKYYAARRL